LEAEGYAVWPIVIPAAAVNAPHRRDRVWFVAYRYSNRWEHGNIEEGSRKSREWEKLNDNYKNGGVGLATDSENARLSPCTERPRQEQSRRRDEPMGARQWQGFPTESPVCSGDDGIPSQLDGITFSKWRNESIKAYGNAIVPQVAYQIFKAIEDHDYRAMA
jgi:DNA (cytosine-5)-methyltransferase 1